MAKVWIDGREHDVDASKNLLDVSLSLGKNLPYFCWHPALGSVGACRQCAVKQYRDENDKQGKLVMACMTQAVEGSRISIEDQDARDFRKSIAELLMVNHPHDCPVCDEGGECHLQDMTVMTGHNYRSYRFSKKTYENQDLGPLVNHEMNRCIQCYRCVHFYRDHAGGKDLQAFAAHDHIYFGRHQSGTLESEFAGNLVEVCPTGVFTDKTLKKHYTRKWDFRTAPSVCVHCSLGCNTIPGERYGEIRRIRNRYHGKVNGYFLCDRGRYGYEFVNHERRLRAPAMRNGAGSGAVASEKSAAVARAAELVADPKKVIGIGSARASLEANFALRTLVGAERFFQGVSDRDVQLSATIVKILREGPARSCSLREIEDCDAVLILGEDVTNTGPLVDLAVRQAIKNAPLAGAEKLKIPPWHAVAVRDLMQEERGPLWIATPAGTKLDEVAKVAVRGTPDDCARLGFAVAKALDPAAPDVPECSKETRDLAARIAEALRSARRPVVIAGTSLKSEAVIQSAAQVAWACAKARPDPAELFFVLDECNSMGAALLGGQGLDSAMQAIDSGKVETLVVLERDLARHVSAEALERAHSRVKNLVVIDSLNTPTAVRAAVSFPAGTYAESDGTFVNSEGRAQRFYQVFVPGDEIQESWRWIRDVMVAAGRKDADWRNLDDVCAAVSKSSPAFAAVPQAAPPASFRILGEKVPREPHRFSGRTAMNAHESMHEPKPPDDPDSPLSFSMEGWEGTAPAAIVPNFWAPGWNSIQALNRFQEEVNGPLRGGDPGVRLVEPAKGARPAYFDRVPAESRRKAGSWTLLPLAHAFGSDETSALSPPIAELAPKPYVELNATDAAELGLRAGDLASLVVDGKTRELPVRMTTQLPRGTAGIPVGLAGFPVLGVPATTTIAPARK
jgi:NADH-quinone oxidoreductase subunit G